MSDNLIDFRQLDEETQELIKERVGRYYDTDEVLISEISDGKLLISYLEPDEDPIDPREMDDTWSHIEIITNSGAFRELSTDNETDYLAAQGVFDVDDIPDKMYYVEDFPEVGERDDGTFDSELLREYIDAIVAHRDSINDYIISLEKEYDRVKPHEFRYEGRMRCDHLRGHIDVMLIPDEEMINEFLPENPVSSTEVDEAKSKLDDRLKAYLKEYEAWANGDVYYLNIVTLENGEFEETDESFGSIYCLDYARQAQKEEHKSVAKWLIAKEPVVA